MPSTDRMDSLATSTTGARGFIVIAALWILAALSGLVLIYLSYVVNTAVVVTGGADRIQTEALAQAGVELAVLQLSGRSEGARPTSGTFNARVGGGRVFVTFRSEAARIDLNAAPKFLLAGLMVSLGAGADNAAVYADRIIAWRAPTELGENDPENSFYRTSGSPYPPRHAPFPAIEELWLVRGIPPAIVERMMPHITVFSNVTEINVLDAAPQVLASLPNVTPAKLQTILSQRTDPALDPKSLIGMAGREGATVVGSRAYRIKVDAELPNGRRSAAEIVVLLIEEGDEPFRILSWRDASDGSATLHEVAAR
ncbi:MAG: type II secretory protein PulK [Bradyrhizobium sp.]